MVTTLYNPVIEERGKKKGKMEGKIEGKIEGKTEDILDILKEYGHVDAQLEKKIRAQKDIDTLKKWVKLAAKVATVDEFVAKMHE